MTGRPERPTLATTLEVLTREAGGSELAELVRLAYDEHEPARTKPPACPSCDTPMPCDMWTYAEEEARGWLIEAIDTKATALNARIDAAVERYRFKKHSARFQKGAA